MGPGGGRVRGRSLQVIAVVDPPGRRRLSGPSEPEPSDCHWHGPLLPSHPSHHRPGHGDFVVMVSMQCLVARHGH